MTTATIEDIRSALATMAASVSGVRRAYSTLPPQIPDADLPAALTFPREATYDFLSAGEDQDVEQRNWLLWVLVAPREQGVPGEMETRAEPFIDAIKTYFKARPSLTMLHGIIRAWLTGDGGPRQLEWAGVVYWGVEFRLSVRILEKRVYADYQ